MAIPRVIHQLWKDAEIPARYRAMRETWRAMHPDWEMRLWTDRDLDDLVERDYPGMLDIYRSYRRPICRADLGRYLVLHRLGGVYADLDCECLGPVGPLIEGAGFVIGQEPDAHLAQRTVIEAGLRRVLCPSFIASAAGHAAWDPVLAAITEARDEPDPLEATGPFLLTRTFDRLAADRSVRILPAAQVYPVAKADCWSGRVHDLEFREAATRGAYVLHYWDGTWFRDGADAPALPNDVVVFLNRPAAPRIEFDETATPTISCVLLSQGRLDAARLAIDAFLAQTWPRKELLIVARATEPRLASHVRALDRPDIRLVRAEVTATAGQMRNLGRDLAAGEVICQWREGDLHDPRRLEIQLKIMRSTGAQAAAPRRWASWRPVSRRLAVVAGAPLADALMCLTAAMPTYPAEADERGDPAMAAVAAGARLALFDLSRLSVRVDDPDPTDAAPASLFEGERYDAVLTQLAKRMPIAARVATRCAGPAAPDVEVRLLGLLPSTVGIGASARGTAEALIAAGVPVTLADIPTPETHPAPLPVAPPREPVPEGDAPWPVTLIHLNPDLLALTVADGRAPFTLADRESAFTIGFWAWETETGAPAAWAAAYPSFDEIWAPSLHAARAIARSAPVPVVVMPHPIAPAPPSLDRDALGLPAGTFVFFFAFDGLSNVERKNPAGLIAAYRLAFPAPSAEVMLLLKARFLTPEETQRLAELAHGRPDIRIVTEPWSDQRLASTMAACDCYVSLHRAEGFGRTMAEAMFHARPVIATAYSGNLDFMTRETACLAPCRLTTLAVADGGYAAGTVWAEPDIPAAARLMAHVAANPAEAAAVGARAARWVRTHLSAEAVGRRMSDRLARKRGARPRTASAPRTRPADPDPTVLIATPVKDAAAQLARYVELVRRLDYDPAKLSLAFLESDSRDGSYDALAAALPELKSHFARAELHRFDFGFHLEGPRWAPEVQRRRREILARSRNRLLGAALREEDWVLWLDADLADYPPDLLRRLLASGKDIVVPHCIGPTGETFDFNTFRFAPETGGRDDPRYLSDGIFQPPKGAGRLYLDAFAGQDIVPVDAVGGTALLVRADLHREGLNFPPFSYRGYIETEGLAMMASDMGRQCWGLPQLRITHS